MIGNPRLHLVAALMIGGVCQLQTAPAASDHGEPEAELPNVLLIIADDLGYRDLSCYGAEDIPTPNLDRLASEGTRFTDAYASYAYCGPSRAGILTGRYQQRFGFDFNVQHTRHGLPVSEKTLAANLKHYGYATAFIGKWHLGELEKFHPLNRGFDEFYGHLRGMRAYYSNATLSPEDRRNRNLSDPVCEMREEVEFEGYITDVFSDKARDFIRRKSGRPFFITLSYNAPHTPIHEKQPEKYLGKLPQGGRPQRRRYGACVNAIDAGVGAVLREMKGQGVYENTMIFFVSDHGGVPWANGSSNGELTGFKDVVYEGGIRTPFIFRWGGGAVGKAAASQPVSTLDIFSTIMAAVDPDYRSVLLDGVNLLQEGIAAELEKRPLFWSVDGGRQLAVRLGEDKLVQLFDYEPELYDLGDSWVEDYEKGIAMAKRKPEKTQILMRLLRDWQATLPEPFVTRPSDPGNYFDATAEILRIHRN